MLLMRSMGSTRTAPANGSGMLSAGPAAVPPGAAPGMAMALTGLSAAWLFWRGAPPVLNHCSAASTSLTETYLSGKTPTDMPLRRLTSKVLMMSSQPSAWARLPASTSRLRTVSTRIKASGGTIGRRMVAISAAPMYCKGTSTAPEPGGSGPLPTPACRTAAPVPLSGSGPPTWEAARGARSLGRAVGVGEDGEGGGLERGFQQEDGLVWRHWLLCRQRDAAADGRVQHVIDLEDVAEHGAHHFGDGRLFKPEGTGRLFGRRHRLGGADHLVVATDDARLEHGIGAGRRGRLGGRRGFACRPYHGACQQGTGGNGQTLCEHGVMAHEFTTLGLGEILARPVLRCAAQGAPVRPLGVLALA